MRAIITHGRGKQRPVSAAGLELLQVLYWPTMTVGVITAIQYDFAL